MRDAPCLRLFWSRSANPQFRAYYKHLLAHGKLKMVALVAAMRKLLHAIYGVFQSLQPFDADKLFSLSITAKIAC